MPDPQPSRSLATTGPQGAIEHAGFRAARSPCGVGAAVTRSGWAGGVHRWDLVVSDGRSHHYLFVLGPLGPRPNVATPEIEAAVEAHAATLPAEGRLRALAGQSPLHVDAAGRVGR